MRKQAAFWVAVCIVISSPVVSQNQKRVSPDEYKRAPASIRLALKGRHCQVPETQHWDETRLNIVSGQFGESEQVDWAALCITPKGTVQALVFWGKVAPCPAEIQVKWALTDILPSGSAGSLYLVAQNPRQILEYRKTFGDDHKNPVTHQGLEIGDNKASQIYYCHQGKWLVLQGAD